MLFRPFPLRAHTPPKGCCCCSFGLYAFLFCSLFRFLAFCFVLLVHHNYWAAGFCYPLLHVLADQAYNIFTRFRRTLYITRHLHVHHTASPHFFSFLTVPNHKVPAKCPSRVKPQSWKRLLKFYCMLVGGREGKEETLHHHRSH